MADRDGKRIEVWADWPQLGGPTPVGVLFARPVRGNEVYSFEYDPGWLTHTAALAIDPGLQLFAGPQHAPDTDVSFGIFLDSAPDRWGLVLMRRREALEARQEARKPRVLRESEYLLGVHDAQRMGALRFRTEPDGPFMDHREALAAPPLARTRELESASLELEQEGAEDDPDYAQWLRLLIAPGSSLGGARPKASVADTKSALWIAKFPSRQDTVDRGAWEYVVHALARRAGVAVAAAQCRRFTAAHHTFLSRRFDRTGAGERLHFMSAMAALGKRDREEASYLEIAEFLMQNGSRVPEDLEELRRTEEIIAGVVSAVRTWREVAKKVGLSNGEQEEMSPAFALAEQPG